MLLDSITGEKREVDIVAESTVGTYTLLLGIECRDHRRRADVTWIEQMSSKHEHLPTSKLVLWSSSGFTSAAVRKAKQLKIELRSQADALDTDWKTIARAILDGLVHLIEVKYTSFIDVLQSSGTMVRLTADGRYVLRGADLDGDVPLGQLMNATRNLPELRNVLLDHAPKGAGKFYTVVDAPTPMDVWDREQRLGALRRLLTEYETELQEARASSKSVRVDDEVLTLVHSNLQGGHFELQLLESRNAAPKFRAIFTPSTKLPD